MSDQDQERRAIYREVTGYLHRAFHEYMRSIGEPAACVIEGGCAFGEWIRGMQGRNSERATPSMLLWLQHALVDTAVIPRVGEPPVWEVEVNNGEGGHAGAGRVVAWCATPNDAALIAEALYRLGKMP